MAVTVTCTPGGASDNSYISSADADSYFGDTLREAAWDSYSSDDRGRALIQATGELEALGGVPMNLFTSARTLFSGEPYSTSQTLHFPRGADLDSDGSKLIPPSIEEATAEQAFFSLARRNDPELLDRDALQDAGVRSISTDGLREKYVRRVAPRNIAPAAWERIRPFIQGGRVACKTRVGSAG